MVAPIDPRTLQAFVAVASEGSVSRAADRLHLSQPAVSLQLKRLAELTGLVLFSRTPRGLALTADGAALLPQARETLAALTGFARAAEGLHGTVRGRLRLGTILDPEFTRLGAFLRELVLSSPQIGTELRQGMSGTVLAQIARGELDAGFYLGDPNATAADGREPQFDTGLLTRFTYRVIAPAGWGPQVLGRDWAALAALPWIRTPPDSVHNRLLSAVFERLGVQPHGVALVDQEASMLDLVRSGVGVSLARDAIAIRESQARGLVIADRVALASSLSFVSLRSERANPVVRSAWAALDRVWDHEDGSEGMARG
ncbi:MAG: LysR family transcriptional regulator [Burkholderiales bacterium]|nr:LysR family transcriptional regulator [Burkholderiales bacterium]